MRKRKRQLALWLALAGTVVGFASHVTPTVTLVSKAEALKQMLPDAQSYFVKKVEIGRTDLEAIVRATDWKPMERSHEFYYGKDEAGNVLGVVTFVTVDTAHGPLALAAGFGPDESVSEVIVTAVTVETRPWVKAIVDKGILERYEGLKPGSEVSAAASYKESEVGAMPYFFGKILDKGVIRTLELYRTLYLGTAADA